MKRPWIQKILRAVTLLLLLPLVFLFWLIATESGMHLVYKYAKGYVPGSIKIGKLEGSLVGRINARNIQYIQNGTTIKLDKLILEWMPAALLSKSIDISHLHLQSLNIQVLASEKNKNNLPVTLPEVNLPWRITLNDVVVDDISISRSEKTKEKINLKQIKLNVSTLFNQVNIKSLTLRTELSELNLKGQLSPAKNYQHKLEIKWRSQLLNKGSLEGKGQIEGDINTFNIQQQVSGPVQLSFKAEVHDLFSQLNWQAEANIIDINPVEIWPEWPGQFKGKLTSNGQTVKGQLNAVIDVSQLTGKLRGFPVTLISHLEIINDSFKLSRFDLSSGKTKFSAQGQMDSIANFNWTLSSTNLAELYPGAQGKLQVKGHLTGSPSAPELKTSLSGQTLSLPGYKIGAIKGEVGLDLFHWKKINILLSAQTLNFNEIDFQSMDINADNHNLQVKLRSEKATAFLELKGEINNQGLQSRIEKADLISSKFADWKLNTSATFNLSKDYFFLEPLCWQSTEGKLCATLQKNNGNWQSHFDISKLPLNLFSHWLPPDLNIEGVTDATADLQFQAPKQLLGQANIKLLQSSVSYPLIDGERQSLKYHRGEIDITLDERGLEAKSELNISNDEHFKAQLMLPGVNLIAFDRNKQALEARAQLNIHNLGLIEAIVPEIQNAKGEAAINFTLSGTLAQPRLSGNAYLNNGSLRIPRLGLNIDQLSLRSENDGFEKLNFQIAARSGEGHIAIQGQTLMDNNAGWPTSITIKGEKFEVAHIPVSQLIVSPDLQIKLHKHSIHITGKVDIPYAKLQPKDVTTAARVSDDVVIVGDNQSIDEKWLIYTKVRLTLGELIHFYGFGFEGRLGGSLLLEDEPGQLTKATGEIKVPEGRYAAYGQQLDVEHGRLLYTGSPITNPGLDLRAVRKIGTVTAGLKVKGSLKKPQIELFSIPAMGQTDALAYLLLGRPIETTTGKDGEMMAKAALALSLIGGDSLARTLGERFGLDDMRVESSSSGDQASLVIGRYLSPKLYVGYGVGLIESFNTFNVRYQISDKWQLKGESGENQGADILYTIER